MASNSSSGADGFGIGLVAERKQSYTIVNGSVVANSLIKQGQALNNWRSSFSTLPAGEADGPEKEALEKLTAEETRRREVEQAKEAARKAAEKTAEDRAVAEKAAAAYKRGSEFVKSFSFKKTIPEFEEAIRLAPGDAQYQDALAKANVNLRNSKIGRVVCLIIGAVLAFVAIKILLTGSVFAGSLFLYRCLSIWGISLVLIGIITSISDSAGGQAVSMFFVGGIVGIIVAVISGLGFWWILLFAIIGFIVGFITTIITYLMALHWAVSLMAVVALAIGIVAFGPAKILGMVSASAAIEASAPQAVTATVTSDALNLRAEPSGGAALVKTLKKGDLLTVTGETANGWTPVEYDGAKGYVSAGYISIDGGE